jgi:hypothetical protein
MDNAKVEELKAAFKLADQSGDNKLDYDEFKALLKRGNESFPESQAETLFATADQDLSGSIDFDELVEYIFNNAGMEKLFIMETTAAEEEAKLALMSKDGRVRAAASKAAKAKGLVWRDMSWQDRLAEALEFEKGSKEDTQARKECAPLKDSRSRFDSVSGRDSPTKKKEFDIEEVKTRHRTMTESVSEDHATQHTMKLERKATMSALPVDSLPGATAARSGTVLPTSKFAIADKSQADIVDYSLSAEDLDFVGRDPAMLEELYAFKDKLKRVGDPLSLVNIVKFIAKGTAGWVFLAERKDTGKKVAMKLIRMTQARSGIREWYLSQLMKKFDISNVVFTDDSVCVFERASAPPVIEQELRNAGPVPYYMALFQVLMPWGTLEDIAKDGEVNPAIMFKCLLDVAETLAAMHAHNIQHRDMKPENVMLLMENNKIMAARLCDLGRAEVINNPEGRKDDIRRFGITFFSVATGEGWTKNRLLREQPDALVSRMAAAVEGQKGAMANCPDILRRILNYELDMAQICEIFSDLEEQSQQ